MDYRKFKKKTTDDRPFIRYKIAVRLTNGHNGFFYEFKRGGKDPEKIKADIIAEMGRRLPAFKRPEDYAFTTFEAIKQETLF